MKITIIGTGYVGLVTGACLADAGNEVWCVDKNEAKIAKLLNGVIPIFEPGLEPLVLRGVKEKRLYFTTDLPAAVQKADICFLTVDTPPNADGSPNLNNIFAASESLGNHLDPDCLVVTKSTVPVGTTFKIKEIILKKFKERRVDAESFAVASNPEFLKEGTSVQDFRHPDRIVVGVENPSAGEKLKELYEPFMRKKDCLLVMDVASSEISKYAANAMLAARISFMNEMSNLCEKVGADIDKVRQSIGWDPRIGPHFLYPGLGYGGSCLPKDVSALIRLGKDKNYPLPLVEAVGETNRRQKENFLQKIARHFGGPEKMKGKNIALWGLAFKPETDDIREAPALFLAENFLKWGVNIRAFDPVAADNVRLLFGDQMQFLSGNYECLEGADCLVIATEWSAFRSPNFAKMKQLMKKPVIFDGRNLYPPAKMKEMGFDYFSIGR